MQLSRFFAAVLCPMTALFALSCTAQQTNPVGRLVDPQVIEVTDGGRQAKVNIGLFDDVHGGQTLYVVRANRPVGRLMVMRPGEYSSECAVVASKKMSELDKDAPVRLADVRVGDLVVRRFAEVSRAGQIRDKVPRMVPIPYEPDDTGTLAEREEGKRTVSPRQIPRDQVDQWKREHPLKSIMREQTGR